MRRSRSFLIVLVSVVLAAAFTGCSKKSTAPTSTAGGNTAVPAIIATQPAPRSPSAPYDTEIWAQFDRPLDGRTVSALSAYLKLDGQRLAVDVS